MKRKIVFLDRDGTICEDSDYLDDWRKMKLYPYAYEAVKLIREKNYEIYILTNQSGVARGKFSIDEAERQRNFVLNYLNKEMIIVKDYLFCPHHRDGVVKEFSFDCECRKPKTGLIEKNMNISDIDKENSYMVGDKLIDVEFALNLGVKAVLVMTGYGKDEIKKAKDRNLDFATYENIYEFAKNL